MGDPVYLLQIVDADTKTLARFGGRGKVERDLMTAVHTAIKERVPATLETMAIQERIPTIIEMMREQGRWWIRPDRFDAALEQVLTEAIPPLVIAVLTDAIPELVATAVNAVLLDAKQAATDLM